MTKLLSKLKLIDENGYFSITTASMYIIMAKLAFIELDLASVTAFFVAMLAHQSKKVINNRAAKVSAAQEKKWNDIIVEQDQSISDLQDKVSQLQMQVSLKRGV